MREPLTKYVKPGVIHFMAYPTTLRGEGPILETLRRILLDPYFEVVEVTWMKDASVRRAAAAMLAASGIEAKYGAQPRLLTQKLDVNSVDEPTRARAVAEMKAAVDEAVELGIRDLALLSGPDPGPDRRNAAMDALERSLLELCAYAADRGVSVALEVFDDRIDKKALIGPAPRAAEIAERVCAQRSNFGLLADLSHLPLLGETPAQALRPIAAYLRHVHIGNCAMKDRSDPAYGDKHPRFSYPASANGVREIAAFLQELFAVNYLDRTGTVRRAISFEVSPIGDDDPEIVLADAKRKLGAAWSMVEEV